MKVREETVANGDMFADYIEWRAKHPSDDLMTQLLNAEFEDEHGEKRTLTREEVLTYTTVLAGAGNETTGRLIGWLAKLLAEHPDQRREVVEDRSLIPQRDRRGAALRADRARHGPLRHAGRRVPRHHHPGRQPDPPADGVGQPRPPPLRRTRTSSTSTATTSSTSPSASGSTSASAPASPASKGGSPSTSSSTASPSGTSTTTA